MAVLPAAAAAAYQAVAKMGGSSVAGAANSSALPANFTDFLSNAVKDSMGSIKAGEC